MNATKTIYTLFLLCILSPFICSSQDTIIAVTRSVVQTRAFNTNIVYYKDSEKKLSKQKVISLIRQNSKTYFKPIYNQEGEIEKYYYDSKQPTADIIKNIPVEKGTTFPPFKLTTVEGEKVLSENLRGKIVVIRFTFWDIPGDVKTQELEAIENQIKVLPEPDDVVAIIINNGDLSTTKRFYSKKKSLFKVVPNGLNFINKYGITRFPSTLVLNREGKLVNTYSYTEDLSLLNYTQL